MLPAGLFAAFQKRKKITWDGEEESCERNPERVPFVFNQKLSERSTDSSIICACFFVWMSPISCRRQIPHVFSGAFL